MKKITLLLLLFSVMTIFAQDDKGDRTGTIFYPTIDRTDKIYDISVDLFELGQAKYVEAELYDDKEVKRASRLFELIYRNKKYYLLEDGGEEKEVSIYDIGFTLKNGENKLVYPMVKIKILNSNYEVIDFSRKNYY